MPGWHVRVRIAVHHDVGMEPRGLLAAVPLLLLVVGCGAQTSVASEPKRLPVRTVDGEVQVGCGSGSSWSPAVMADGVPGVVERDVVVEAFRELLADPELSGELELSFLSAGAEETEWRVLAGDGDALTLGLGSWTEAGPAEGARTFAMAREGRRWRWLGGGDCPHLGPVLADDADGWVEVTGLSAPAADTGEVTVVVSEIACTGARDPGPFLHEPTVVETDQSVTVYWTTTPPESASCPGNPSVERTLELDAPLGERALLDGSSWPPAPVPRS